MLLHFFEQYKTSSQFFFHFFLQLKGLLQLLQIFEGKLPLVNFIIYYFIYCVKSSVVLLKKILAALKIANPAFVYLNRGNHESEKYNVIYGFEREVVEKYDKRMKTSKLDSNTKPRKNKETRLGARTF